MGPLGFTNPFWGCLGRESKGKVNQAMGLQCTAGLETLLGQTPFTPSSSSKKNSHFAYKMVISEASFTSYLPIILHSNCTSFL